MIQLNNRYLMVFFLSAFVIWALLGLSQLVYADSAMKAYAEANQRQYREIRKLGAAATPDKIQEINQRSFASAAKLMQEERSGKTAQWRKAIFGGEKSDEGVT